MDALQKEDFRLDAGAVFHGFRAALGVLLAFVGFIRLGASGALADVIAEVELFQIPGGDVEIAPRFCLPLVK